MKALALLFAANLLIPLASAQEPITSKNIWRYYTDPQYRAERFKATEDAELRAAPIYGRLSACSLAQGIVAAPMEWRENTHRIANIPAVLQVYGVEFTSDFKAFQDSATALIVFSAQLQSATREQVSSQLATEREHTSHNLNVEANIEPNLFALYSGLHDSEHQTSSERKTIENQEFPALTPEQAETFRRLYAQLLSDYTTVLKRLPTINELVVAGRPQK